jgi:bifunctional N-acetylglucosamine-1-phosphate-uridyltransferase/glucosamine-1-phosphate-acetyltransferase GlmU-like protein
MRADQTASRSDSSRPATRPRIVHALIPAAGRGTRLGASHPKFLQPIDGVPLIGHLLSALTGLVTRAHLVVSPSGEHAWAAAGLATPVPVDLHVQQEPTGMADAILSAASLRLEDAPPDVLVIIWGDQAGLRRQTIASALDAHAAAPSRPIATIPVVQSASPYVHYETDAGRLIAVHQQREGDAMPPEGIVDCGCFIADTEPLFETLIDARRAPEALRGRRTGEMNFLPALPLLARRGCVQLLHVAMLRDTIGINTPADLERLRRGGERTT